MASRDVIVTDATGSRQQEATVPEDARSIRLIAKLIELLGLPLAGPDGQPLSYKFHHRSSGRQLRDDETLAEAGVHDGDTLRLVAEITAG
jgi:WXG100 protein secretion system (Wss), protein YukD